MRPLSSGSKPEIRYQIRDEIGHGGSGIVSLAWDSQLERTVAIKRLKPDGLHLDLVQSARQEAMRLASIRHANIVAVHDMGTDEQGPYLVLEYVSGETLDQRVARGVLPMAEFIMLAEQTLEGLVAAHHAGLLHRDLKPANLMLALHPSGSFQVKILDFGISQFLARGPAGRPPERGDSITGSIYCVAPEQLNREPFDQRSDLYSLGCVFYYALAGHFPFEGRELTDVANAHLYHEVTPLSELRPDLPPRLSDWLMTLIQRRPEQRFEDAKRALAALMRMVEQPDGPIEPIPRATAAIAMPPPTAAAASPASPAKPWAFAVLSAATLITLGSAGAAWYLLSPHQAKPSASAPAESATPAPDTAKPPAPEAADESDNVPAPSAATEPGDPVAPAPVAGVPAAAATIPGSVILRFQGTNTLGAKLVPTLVERFLQREGAASVKRVAGRDRESALIEAALPDLKTTKAISINGRGTPAAFGSLESGAADIGMAARAIKDHEIKAAAKTGGGDLSEPGCEHVLALDAIAVFVHPTNPIPSLTKAQIAGIFNGRINDWSEVGSKTGPIHLYLRETKTGTFETLRSLLHGAGNLRADAKRSEENQGPALAVAGDPDGIGLASLAYVHDTKVIGVADADTAAVPPTRLTVGSEEYPLMRRLYLYTVAAPQNPLVKKFIDFALSDEGQELVAKAGFINQTLEVQPSELSPGSPEEYRQLVKDADRLTVNFRFKEGGLELDSKAGRDLDRVAAFFADKRYHSRKLLLLGFASASDQPTANKRVSDEHAQTVADELARRGVHAYLATGLGASLSLPANDAEPGREKGPRVEAWIMRD